MRKMVYSTGVLSVVGIVGVGGFKRCVFILVHSTEISNNGAIAHRMSQWINQLKDLLLWGYIFSTTGFEQLHIK